jgi:hypothetical protein
VIRTARPTTCSAQSALSGNSPPPRRPYEAPTIALLVPARNPQRTPGRPAPSPATVSSEKSTRCQTETPASRSQPPTRKNLARPRTATALGPQVVRPATELPERAERTISHREARYGCRACRGGKKL